jgi:hypothetical protein
MSLRGFAAVLGVLALVVGMSWLYAGPRDGTEAGAVIVIVVGLVLCIGALTSKPPTDRG